MPGRNRISTMRFSDVRRVESRHGGASNNARRRTGANFNSERIHERSCSLSGDSNPFRSVRGRTRGWNRHN